MNIKVLLLFALFCVLAFVSTTKANEESSESGGDYDEDANARFAVKIKPKVRKAFVVFSKKGPVVPAKPAAKKH